jgi:hypothetical protein
MSLDSNTITKIRRFVTGLGRSRPLAHTDKQREGEQAVHLNQTAV